MTPDEVGPVCNVDWGPVISGLQTVLAAAAALIGAYTLRLIRNGAARTVGFGRRKTDHPAPVEPGEAS